MHFLSKYFAQPNDRYNIYVPIPSSIIQISDLTPQIPEIIDNIIELITDEFNYEREPADSTIAIAIRGLAVLRYHYIMQLDKVVVQ